MGEFERALARTEADAIETQRAAEAVVKAAKALVVAARLGDIAALEKALADTKSRTNALNVQQRNTDEGWDFDVPDYLGTGFVAEVREAAGGAGLTLHVDGDRIFSYPVLIRLLPAESAVTIDRKKSRSIRPSYLTQVLKRANVQPPKFKPADFLKALHAAYLLAAPEAGPLAWDGQGPTLQLAKLFEILTVFPGSPYSKQEFARDLYLLDSSGVTETAKGEVISFHSSRPVASKQFELVDRDGNRKIYYAISFGRRS